MAHPTRQGSDAPDDARGAAAPDDAGSATTPSSHRGSVLRLPSPRALARHALPSVIEGSIAPTALFFLMLTLIGFRGALLAALAWSYLAMARRLWRRERVPALLGLGVALLTTRTLVSFVTGSAVLYFLQPAAGTVLVALLFLVTALAGRPLVERLARDFYPLDDDLAAHPHVRRFFRHISLLWAALMLTNAAIVVVLLFVTSLHAFVVERTLVTWALTGGGILLSTWLFVRTLRRAGIAVHFGARADGPTGDSPPAA
jgi:uncharacterized membrane protein